MLGMAIRPAAGSCSRCLEGSAFRSSAWEKAAADATTLLHRPNQFSVARLVVPQEGFEPPTPSLPSENSGSPSSAPELARIRRNATSSAVRSRFLNARMLHVAALE
jgi:hypothetical protein